MNRMRYSNSEYLLWIKTLPCVCCEGRGTTDDPIVPHHLIGVGGIAQAMGGKAGDNWAMPMKASCHRLWHAHPIYDLQWIWVARTMAKALEDGILVLSEDVV